MAVPASVEQPAVVLVGGGNPDPLHNFTDIQQAVNDMAKENPNTVPLAEMLGLMAKELCSLTLAQKLTKKDNSVLLAAARKAKVDKCVSKLSNVCQYYVCPILKLKLNLAFLKSCLLAHKLGTEASV